MMQLIVRLNIGCIRILFDFLVVVFLSFDQSCPMEIINQSSCTVSINQCLKRIRGFVFIRVTAAQTETLTDTLEANLETETKKT